VLPPSCGQQEVPTRAASKRGGAAQAPHRVGSPGSGKAPTVAIAAQMTQTGAVHPQARGSNGEVGCASYLPRGRGGRRRRLQAIHHRALGRRART
jgi:hypothetical protein